MIIRLNSITNRINLRKKIKLALHLIVFVNELKTYTGISYKFLSGYSS